jgi:hypothetical protein
MAKKEVVWLITKLIGVLFAYWTVVAVFILISSVYAYIQLPAPPRFGKTENQAVNVQPISPGIPVNPTLGNTASAAPVIETPAEKAKNDALKELLWNLFLTVIYGFLGWYLIRDGRILFAILNREAPFDESGKPVETDSFPLGKKKESVVTTLNLSDDREEARAEDRSESIFSEEPR